MERVRSRTVAKRAAAASGSEPTKKGAAKSAKTEATPAAKGAKSGGTTKRPSRKELNAYFKTYKKGVDDYHWPLFRAVNEIALPKAVLYAGSHRHITASLVFSDVVYVDSYAAVGACFSDPVVLDWVEAHKEYSTASRIVYKCKNFEANIGEKAAAFDLLLSLSAGIVSKPCGKYLKTGGYLLASDAHFDARMAYVDPNFRLTAVWDGEQMDASPAGLAGHFVTTKGKPISAAQVQESIEKPKAKRSFKLHNETLFYLFQKIK